MTANASQRWYPSRRSLQWHICDEPGASEYSGSIHGASIAMRGKAPTTTREGSRRPCNAQIHADDHGKTKVAAASSFAALDRNGDHRISRSEAGFDRIMSQTFAEIDTDGDGFVSQAEFAAAAEKPRATVTNADR
jgi:hypothetical protein